MNFHSLRSLADDTVADFVPAASARIRKDTAIWIAYLAEFDRRKLFVPEGYSSLYDYCTGKLELSRDEACKYIRVARAARKFPAIFGALADRRLHLSGVVLLARHLTPENAEGLLEAAQNRSRRGIEQLLAEKFPSSVHPAETWTGAAPTSQPSFVPAQPETASDSSAPGRIKLSTTEPAPVPVIELSDVVTPSVANVPRDSSASGRMNGQEPFLSVTPIAPYLFAARGAFDQEMHDDLERLRELLSHQIPSGNLARVMGHALKLAIREAEKRKLGATMKPRTNSASAATRHIPAHVRRAVHERDGGRCTFVSDTGHRCEARKFIEFDHVEPVARGGQSTVANVRLRCRAHNQLAADRALGTDFMRRKRESAQSRRDDARQRAEAEQARAEAAEKARIAAEQVRAAAEAQKVIEKAKAEVIPLLRQLGFRAEEARRAAANSATDPRAPLQERVRLALRHLSPPCVHRNAPAVAAPA